MSGRSEGTELIATPPLSGWHCWFISTPKTNEATLGKQLRPEFSNAKYDSAVKKHLLFEALSARSSPLKRAPGGDERRSMFGIGPAARRRGPPRLLQQGRVPHEAVVAGRAREEVVRPASGVWIKREPRAVSLTRAAVRAGKNSWRSARRKIKLQSRRQENPAVLGRRQAEHESSLAFYPARKATSPPQRR